MFVDCLSTGVSLCVVVCLLIIVCSVFIIFAGFRLAPGCCVLPAIPTSTPRTILVCLRILFAVVFAVICPLFVYLHRDWAAKVLSKQFCILHASMVCFPLLLFVIIITRVMCHFARVFIGVFGVHIGVCITDTCFMVW